MQRYIVTIFFVVFAFVAGWLIRFGAGEITGWATFFDSFKIDAILVVSVIVLAQLILARLNDQISALFLIAASVALAFVSGGVAFFLVELARDIGILPHSNSFDEPVIYAYYTMHAALYNLLFLWERQARLASLRALEVLKAERRAALSELRRLRTQIQPHFLFNMLNNIQIEIGNSPPQASLMLSKLGDHLRLGLELEDTLFISLESEIASQRSFVGLQQMRFGTDITLRIDVTDEAQRRLVPTFLLLPLVENATKFGYRPNRGEVDVVIEASCAGPTLNIAISNPGSLAYRRVDLPGTQTGLTNLQSRLALHYPNKHSFSLQQEDDRVTARLSLEGPPC
jgi:two-component system, LytTR family, sensor kinase